MTEDSPVILFVCHSNLCQSPMAEYLLRRAVGNRLGTDDPGVRVSSAGTDAWASRPMHPFAVDVLEEVGVAGVGFRSRRLTPAMVEQADLVLTATRRQRSTAVAMDPASVKRAFTMAQFGRLAGEVLTAGLLTATGPAERLRQVVETVPMVRGHLPVAPLDEDEIADPARQPVEAFRRCAGELGRVVDVVARIIVPIR